MFPVALLRFAALVSLVSASPKPDELVVRRVKRDASDSDSISDMLPRVRRSNYYASASEDSSEESSGPHCVVWGDWLYNGRRFHNKQEADQYFKQKARTELAAIHIHGFSEVNRFMSPRLKSVKWEIMKEWCSKHSDNSGSSLAEEQEEEDHVAPSRRVEMRVGRNGAISDASDAEDMAPSPSLPELRMRHHSHHAAPAPSLAELRTQRRSKFSPVTSRLSAPDAGSVNQASTLSGKASVLENEITQLDTTTTGLLQSVGIDGSSFGSASLMQSGGTRATHRNPGNLHQRIASLEQGTSVVLAKTNALELEFFGTTTADKNTNVQHKDSENSFKGKVVVLSAHVEDLKGKVSALVSSPLLSEAAKLEGKTTQLADKAKNIYSAIGVEGATALPKPSGGPVLKVRLNALGEYAEQLQRSASLLEYEILGSSWNLNVSGVSLKGASIKDHDASLGTKLNDLESRLATLAAAPIVSDVGRLEDAVATLASRAAALSTKVGASQANVASSAFEPTKTGTLSTRIASLALGVEKMQSTTSTLEEELAGNIGTMPAHSQKGTMKGKVKFLELNVENLNARMSAMEQQV